MACALFSGHQEKFCFNRPAVLGARDLDEYLHHLGNSFDPRYHSQW